MLVLQRIEKFVISHLVFEFRMLRGRFRLHIFSPGSTTITFTRGVKVRISDDSLSFSELFVASMKKLPIFAEVVGVPLVESGALFILMSP